jgi:hypothetical protein
MAPRSSSASKVLSGAHRMGFHSHEHRRQCLEGSPHRPGLLFPALCDKPVSTGPLRQQLRVGVFPTHTPAMSRRQGFRGVSAEGERNGRIGGVRSQEISSCPFGPAHSYNRKTALTQVTCRFMVTDLHELMPYPYREKGGLRVTYRISGGLDLHLYTGNTLLEARTQVAFRRSQLLLIPSCDGKAEKRCSISFLATSRLPGRHRLRSGSSHPTGLPDLLYRLDC